MREASLFFVVNPTAGSGRAGRLWPALVERLKRRRRPFAYEMTRGPDTATSFTRHALRAGAETVVAVGGDGTINEVINGFFLNDRLVRAGATLGIIPAGSSCDLARNLGIPSGLDAVDTLLDGSSVQIDVGRERGDEAKHGEPYA